jgi:hypothetical protein
MAIEQCIKVGKERAPIAIAAVGITTGYQIKEKGYGSISRPRAG